jgi:hypothetical protein
VRGCRGAASEAVGRGGDAVGRETRAAKLEELRGELKVEVVGLCKVAIQQ